MIDLNKQVLLDQHYRSDVEDLKRIQKAFFNQRSLFITLDEAAIIWQTYSSNLCASWLDVPDKDEDIVKHIESDREFKGFLEV